MSTLKPQNTRALARGAIIAALYTALTVLLAPLSYGEVQIRFSEAFTLLPILMPEAVRAAGGLPAFQHPRRLHNFRYRVRLAGHAAGRRLHAPPARQVLAGRADAGAV